MIDKIRLIYIRMEKFNKGGDPLESRIGQTLGVSSPFVLPKGVSLNNACKLVSYLSKKVEEENQLEPASEASVALVSNLLGEYGFSKVEGYNHGHIHVVSYLHIAKKIEVDHCEVVEGCADLFTVDGSFKLFKKSNLYKRYFNWFDEKTKKEEIDKIFSKKK